MTKAFEMRASMVRHVSTVVGSASLFLLAIGASRLIRRLASGGDTPFVGGLLLLWLVVAVGAALVALLIPRPHVSLDGQILLLLGLPARRRAYRLEEIAEVASGGGWPHLKIKLRSGRQITYSLFTFRPADRQRLLQTLAGAASPAAQPGQPHPAGDPRM